jgi:hypothetical protein
MKIGYSLLLGEYINAEDINYVDCKNFQIVCPSCKEPIFKVERQFETQAIPIHYLSHYSKDKAYVDECELRVNKISQAEIETANSLSRNQKLEYFLSVFKDAVLENEYPQGEENLKSVKFLLGKLSKSAAVQMLRDRMYENARQQFLGCSEKGIYTLFNSYINDVQTLPKTSFSIEMQKRIAFDMWKHLLSAKTRGNFHYLFFHSYLMLMSRIEKAKAVRDLHEFELYLHNGMRKLMDSTKQKGQKIFAKMIQYSMGPPYAMENSNLLIKMASEINHEMFGCLLRLPYFEMIRKATFSDKVKGYPN